MLHQNPPRAVGGQGGLGMVVPIYCICQPHHHALASWHSSVVAGKGMEHEYATSSSTDTLDHDNFPMGLMASCRMRTSVSTMSSLGLC